MQDDFGLGTDTDAAYGLEGEEWSTGVGEPSIMDLSTTFGSVTEEPSADPARPVDPWEVEGGAAADDAEVSRLPTEVRFGASIGPYGTTADSYEEEYNYSTTTGEYIGAQSGRVIDEWTGTEKKT